MHEGEVEDGHGGDWKRDDEWGIDERARHGFTGQDGPRLNNMPNWETASLFALGCLFLPMHFISLMAVRMTEVGRQKDAEGLDGYVGWTVSSEDILQRIGVWICMLAFLQAGDRMQYFEEPTGGFGPRHARMLCPPNLCAHTSPATDDFHNVRMFWDELRNAFNAAVIVSWLMVLDESQWCAGWGGKCQASWSCSGANPCWSRAAHAVLCAVRRAYAVRSL
eukprot:3823728-Pleurochrysis_carterae.AAC.2